MSFPPFSGIPPLSEHHRLFVTLPPHDDLSEIAAIWRRSPPPSEPSMSFSTPFPPQRRALPIRSSFSPQRSPFFFPHSSSPPQSPAIFCESLRDFRSELLRAFFPETGGKAYLLVWYLASYGGRYVRAYLLSLGTTSH